MRLGLGHAGSDARVGRHHQRHVVAVLGAIDVLLDAVGVLLGPGPARVGAADARVAVRGAERPAVPCLPKLGLAIGRHCAHQLMPELAVILAAHQHVTVLHGRAVADSGHSLIKLRRRLRVVAQRLGAHPEALGRFRESSADE
eukprot:6377605-Pyramimonas_sp.AAC.1